MTSGPLGWFSFGDFEDLFKGGEKLREETNVFKILARKESTLGLIRDAYRAFKLSSFRYFDSCSWVIIIFNDKEIDNALLLNNQDLCPECGVAFDGFLEVGESLEEERNMVGNHQTNIKVGEVNYHSSQPWPEMCSHLFSNTFDLTDVGH
ncbi:hypothetical protein R6Q59_033080 [Mikania micrantha]